MRHGQTPPATAQRLALIELVKAVRVIVAHLAREPSTATRDDRLQRAMELCSAAEAWLWDVDAREVEACRGAN